MDVASLLQVEYKQMIMESRLTNRHCTVESRSIVSTSIVFPHVLFAIFGPELSSI